MVNEQEILRYIGKQSRHIAGFKQIAHDLSVKGKERRPLQQLLAQLTRNKKLVAIGKDRWSLPTAAASQDLVVGRLRMHRDGFGFVVPEQDSLPAYARGKLHGDLFIPPPATGNAMHGDKVLAELTVVRHDGRGEGRVLRVLEREQETVVGTFHYGHRSNHVTPMDDKIAMEIIIPAGMEYPISPEDSSPSPKQDHLTAKKGRQTSPHRVLGAEALRKQWEDMEGVVVEVEITQWPSATQNPRGRVTGILGYENDFGVDVEMIIRKHHIRHIFPAEVLEEAQEISPVIAHAEIERRRDFRELPIVTIDGETARDFDDAVLVRRQENGNYQLHVHIADVAYYVEEDSALDEEARQRGTSVYFPDRAVPMLPLELSTDICSLRPNTDRLVMSCIMEINAQGEITAYELAEGVIRSAQRMTYTDVNAILENDEHLRRKYSGLGTDFKLMLELAQILNRKRGKRGSIDFDLPEPVIEFDEHGMMKSISRSGRNWAHRLIEEFMLAANETVAAHLEARVAAIYRIHEKPDPKRIYDFETIAAGFGYSLGVGSLPVKRMTMRADKRSHYGSGRKPPTVEVPEDVHITPRMYQKLVQKIAGKPEEQILSYLMLRSLKQARYSEINEGHFALAAPCYTHFTSPIRRYPDLVVHRLLRAVLRREDTRHPASPLTGGAAPWSKRRGKTMDNPAQLPAPIPESELHDIAESSSRTERAASEAERELLEWKKMKFMETRLGEDFAGLIVSVTKYGFFVELYDFFIEGLVPLNSLTGDHYTFHENTRQIIGGRSRKTFSIGNSVRVIADRIDRVQRKIQFALLDDKPQPTKKPKAKTKKRS